MRVGIIVGLMLIPALLAAQNVVPAQERFDAFLAERADRSISELTVQELTTAIDLLSVISQQRTHVERSVRLTWVLPGLGHYINGDYVTAYTLAAADIAVGLTTLVIATQILPAAVRHRNLNYLQSSHETIRSRWMSVSPSEMIPALATLATGAMVGLTLRFVATASARESGLDALRRGAVTFDPQPFALPGVSPSSATLRSYSSSDGSPRR
jgi:hypothetical protein